MLFSDDFDAYPLTKSNYHKSRNYRCQSPISGVDLENIAITGSGIIDGSGDAWRPVKRFKMTRKQWEQLIKSGGVLNDRGDMWYPSAKALEGSKRMEDTTEIKDMHEYEEIKDFLRPVLLSLVHCKRILLEGVTFQNSPGWCLHPLLCENIIIQDVTVRNSWYSQNGDGLDIESCRNGIVQNCKFDVGDDAICVKSGKDKEGRDRNVPSENFIIKDCIVYHGHGGFVIGSEMSGGVKNFFVSNCVFVGTDVGLRFKSRRGRGGVVQNIYIEKIYMVDVATDAILFTTYYEGQAPTEREKIHIDTANVPELSEETPGFRDFAISDIVCSGAQKAISIFGLPELSIMNIRFNNLTMHTKKGIECLYADSICFNTLQLNTDDDIMITLNNCQFVTINEFNEGMVKNEQIHVMGEVSDNIMVNTKRIK